jgi:formyltetrahydrofolate hydrolase
VRIISYLQMQVAGSPFRRYPKQVINIHADFSPGYISLS